MGMTMSQKILAAHAGLEEVKAGQLIEADLDLVLGNDITSPVAINEMKKMDRKTVFDKDKIALVMDHFIPNKDIKSAENCKCCIKRGIYHEQRHFCTASRPASVQSCEKHFRCNERSGHSLITVRTFR